MAEDVTLPEGFEVVNQQDNSSLPEGFEVVPQTQTSIPSGFTPVDKLPEETKKEVKSNQSEFETIGRARFGDDKINQWKQNPIKLGEIPKFLDAADTLPLGGLYKAYETYGIKGIAEKQQQGQPLTDGETKTLNDFIDKTVEMRVRGFSVPAGIAYYGAQMPAFMSEFALTGGALSTGKALLTKGITKTAEAATEKAVATSAISAATNIAAGTAAVGAVYTPTYAERRLNDFMAVTDKGEQIFKQSEESPAKSALMSAGYTAIQFGTEATGPYIGKYLINPITNALKTPCVLAINKAPVALQTALYDAYRAIKPNATISEAFSKVGFNSMLEELGENRVQDILNGVMGLAGENNYTYDDFIKGVTPDSHQFAIEAGLIGVVGGARASLGIISNHMQNKGATPEEIKETTDNISANEQEAVANQVLPLPKGEYDKSPKENIVDANLNYLDKNKAPLIDNSESGFNKTYREWVSRIYDIEKLNDKSIAPGENPYLLAKTFGSATDFVSHTLQIGTFKLMPNGDTIQTGEGLKPILDDYSNKILPYENDVSNRMDDLSKYLISRRMIEDIANKPNLKISSDVLAKQIAEAKDNMKGLNDKYGDQIAWFDKTATRIYDFEHRIFQQLADSGLMSQEKVDGILAENPNHIPMQRIFDEDELVKEYLGSGRGFTGANANKIVKIFEGSQRAVRDVFENEMKQTAKIIYAAKKNEILKSIVSLADNMPDKIRDVTDLKGGAENSITVFINGEKKRFQLAKPLYDSVMQLNPVQLGFLQKAFNVPINMLRVGATLIPDFWISNSIRDFFTANMQANVKITPIDLAKSAYDMLGSKEMYNKAIRSGGFVGGYLNENEYAAGGDFYKDIIPSEKEVKDYIKGAISLPAKASSFVESMTRLAVFTKAKEKGLSDIEAAKESRDATLDFQRGGTNAQVVNRYFIPFFNAGMQSLDAMAKTFHDKPVESTMWGLATITMPSVMLTGYYLYAAPDDEREEYLNFPEWQKDTYWMYKAGDQWIKIPKPFSYGYIFGTVPERVMLDTYNGSDKPEAKDKWMELAKGVIGSISPVNDPSALIPQAMFLKPVIEALSNYNFFTGKHIYAPWMERELKPEERFNTYTSETAKMIGKQLGISPAIIDNTMQSTLGGGGKYVTDAGDYLINSLRSVKGEQIPEKPAGYQNYPITRRFTSQTPSGFRAEQTRVFLENFQGVSQVKDGIKQYEGEEKSKYLEDNANNIAAYNSMKGFNDRISALSKRVKTITVDPNMSGEDKKNAIQDLEKQIFESAKQGNEVYKQIMGND